MLEAAFVNTFLEVMERKHADLKANFYLLSYRNQVLLTSVLRQTASHWRCQSDHFGFRSNHRYIDRFSLL